MYINNLIAELKSLNGLCPVEADDIYRNKDIKLSDECVLADLRRFKSLHNIHLLFEKCNLIYFLRYGQGNQTYSTEPLIYSKFPLYKSGPKPLLPPYFQDARLLLVQMLISCKQLNTLQTLTDIYWK